MNDKFKSFAMLLVSLGALLFSLLFGSSISNNIQSFLYTLSLIIKEILIFLLPFIIFSLVFNSISKLGSKAMRYILIILPLICISNFINTMLSYWVATRFLKSGWELSSKHISQEGSQLSVIFSFHLPQILSNDMALCSGVILGLFFGIFKINVANYISQKLDKFTQFFFKGLLPAMPLFIIGTTLKLQNDGVLASIFESYLPIFIFFIVSSYGMVGFQFFILAQFKLTYMLCYIRNIMPAVITAFGSASSAAALPLSIKAAEKNVSQPANADIIVPSTVNVHLVGDCFFIPMIAIAVLRSFGMDIPLINTYLIFALHFVFAKFAVAAIPGGGILVMLPILQNYLGLTSDMLALITALYLLFDPIITACNVAGNGAIAILFDRITSFFSKK